jgi:hypothetical protein
MAKFEFIEFLNEGITHIEHPEDLVFSEGSSGAVRGLESLEQVIAKPKNITIKWDGFPALVFGRNQEGNLIVVDKHMFTKKDGSALSITSPQKFTQYDQARGANRTDLWNKISELWDSFEQAVPAGMRGYYWGDLLWTGTPTVKNGEYVFKPNTVLYHVPVDSELGARIGESNGGIVIHQYFSDPGSNPSVINDTGNLNVNGPMAIMLPNMTDQVKLKLPVQLHNRARATIKKYAGAVDNFLNKETLVAMKVSDLPSLMKTFVNARIRGETRDFTEWLPTKLSGPKQIKLFGDGENPGYLQQNSQGVEGAFAIYEAIAALKNHLVNQLDDQQKTIKASVNDEPGGEGYVTATPGGLIKLVNRSAFSAANFAKNM